MKNKKWYVLVWMLIFSASVVFSGEMNDLIKVTRDDIESNKLSVLAAGGDRFGLEYYVFCTTFIYAVGLHFYELDAVNNIVNVYSKETRFLSKQDFLDKLNDSNSIQKLFEDNGHICYKTGFREYFVQTPDGIFYEFSGKPAYKLNPFTASLTNDFSSSSSRIPMPNPNEPKSYKQGYLADMDSDDFYRYLYDDTDSSYDDGNDMLEYLYDEANPYTRDRILNFIKQYVSDPLASRMVALSDESDNPSVVKTVNRAYKAHNDTGAPENGEVWYYVFYDGNDVFLVLSHTADDKFETSYVYNIY